MTGAAGSALAELLRDRGGAWLRILASSARVPAFRAELRNLVARGRRDGLGEADAGGAHFFHPVGGQVRCTPPWEGRAVPGIHPNAARGPVAHPVPCCGLVAWEGLSARGVQAPCPVPDVVIVDDLQDCTPATLTLLTACRTRCATGVLGFRTWRGEHMGRTHWTPGS